MKKKKALLLTFSKYQDHEVIYPYYRLLEAGFEVDIMADKVGRIHGILGTYMESKLTTEYLKDDSWYNSLMREYDMLVIPGGVKALEKLRQEKKALQFVHDWDAKGKTIACICHGAQMLISAKIVKGRKVSGYYSIRDDIENAGAEYVDEPFVVSENLVSCPHYKWMGEWMQAALRVHEERAGGK